MRTSSWLHVHLPATEATATNARLTHTSRALQAPAETRTLVPVPARAIAVAGAVSART